MEKAKRKLKICDASGTKKLSVFKISNQFDFMFLLIIFLLSLAAVFAFAISINLKTIYLPNSDLVEEIKSKKPKINEKTLNKIFSQFDEKEQRRLSI